MGVVENTLPPGSVGCPFHWHLREDEVFFVLDGEPESPRILELFTKR